MINGKEFLDLDEQVAFLRDANIDVGNIHKTKEILSKHSYYTIINGFREPFLFRPDPTKYIRNVQFGEIFSLYKFDRDLKDWIFPFILQIENIIKTEVVYAFSKEKDNDGKYLRPKDEYLKIDNYDVGPKGTKGKKIDSAIGLIARLQNRISTSFKHSSAFQHYISTYAYLPLWVLSTQMTFGEISTFYECMKQNNKQAVAQKYHMSDRDLSTILRTLTLARNFCAHGNRLYCFTHTYNLPLPDARRYPIQSRFLTAGIGQRKLFGILICIKYFIGKKEFSGLINQINFLLGCLTKQLSSISIQKIYDIMGFPANWLDIKL